ncbi:MAG TPA: PPOX class F420-dependent oxidoreductase [Acidimicrobiia bacterium]|jgi:pyridoxamine 5'-phosphate oxidase family protein|nr:PPOX class F420-dependent oxidoreductase [Acidimicrobiia bacterium]
MDKLTPAQLAYLHGERRLARLATADQNGRPHVTPVGMWRYNDDLGTIDVSGHDLAATKKYRNVVANPQAALVVDDLASVDPWHPRAVVVQGSAAALDEDGQAVIRIRPNKIISWGMGD